MSNLNIKTYTTNDSWTCPAGVTSVTVIPKIKKSGFDSKAFFALQLGSNGSLYSFGRNDTGQLGTGDILARSSPTLVVGGYNFQQVFSSYNNSTYSWGLTSNGNLYTWGSNTYGQLGDNTAASKSSPVPVVGGYIFQQIFTADYYTLSGQLADGSCYTWGYNAAGQLGDNSVVNKSSPVPVIGGYKFKKIYMINPGSSSSSVLGLLSDGTTYAWGYNVNGELGVGDTAARSSPTLVVGGYNFQQFNEFNAGVFIGLTSDGTAYSWGGTNIITGTLGVGDVIPRSSPTLVIGGYKFKKIYTISSCFGLTYNGDLYAWGTNTYGVLGTNEIYNLSPTTTKKSSPTLVVGGYKFQQFSSSGAHALGLSVDGNCYAWGYNAQGQLGNGTVNSTSSPVLVIGGYTFKQIYTTTSASSYGITTEGKVYSWGYNTDGELGDSTAVNSASSPVLVIGGNIIDYSTDDSRITDYNVTPGTTYNIVLNGIPTFNNNVVAPLSLDSMTIQYYT